MEDVLKKLSKEKFWRIYGELIELDDVRLTKEEIVSLAVSLLEFEPDNHDNEVSREVCDYYLSRDLDLSNSNFVKSVSTKIDDYSEISIGDFSTQTYIKAKYAMYENFQTGM